MKKSIKQISFGILAGMMLMFIAIGVAISAPVSGTYIRDTGTIMSMRGLDSNGNPDTCVHNSKSEIIWAGTNGKPCTFIYE